MLHGVSAAEGSGCNTSLISRTCVTEPDDSRSGDASSLVHDAEDLLDGGQALTRLAEAVAPQRQHPLHLRRLLDVLGGAALDDQPLDLLGDEHHLVEREA